MYSRSETNDEQGSPVSRISVKLEKVNVFNRDDWPAIISFFKPRIVWLDSFWTTIKINFEQ